MAKFKGDQLVIEWLSGSGTAALSGQYHALHVQHGADVIDITSGTVANREFLAGPAFFSIRLEGYHNGTASPLGTADLTALAPRSGGTVRVSPLGTATGQPYYLGSALVTGRTFDFTFDDLATVSIEWRGSGALTQGTW